MGRPFALCRPSRFDLVPQEDPPITGDVQFRSPSDTNLPSDRDSCVWEQARARCGWPPERCKSPFLLVSTSCFVLCFFVLLVSMLSQR